MSHLLHRLGRRVRGLGRSSIATAEWRRRRYHRDSRRRMECGRCQRLVLLNDATSAGRCGVFLHVRSHLRLTSTSSTGESTCSRKVGWGRIGTLAGVLSGVPAGVGMTVLLSQRSPRLRSHRWRRIHGPSAVDSATSTSMAEQIARQIQARHVRGRTHRASCSRRRSLARESTPHIFYSSISNLRNRERTRRSREATVPSGSPSNDATSVSL